MEIEGLGEFLLEEILDGLHVVVGGLLDVLHALRIGHGELGDDLVDRLHLRRRHLARADLRIGRQRLQPGALDEHTPLDEAVFGEDLLKLRALVRIPPVNRAHRQKGIDVHGTYYTKSAPATPLHARSPASAIFIKPFQSPSRHTD